MPEKMRRGDKEISDPDELHRVLDEALVARLGMVDEGRPYVVPLNFAREGDELWLHCAAEGRKLRCLSAEPSVCVEVDRVIEVTSGTSACGWNCRYESVIGFGVAAVVTDDESRLRGLQALMGKYSRRRDWQFPKETLARTVIVCVRLDSLTGKRSPAKT
jgi:nitroimidazol reductase NimA-like FMN-containing flavoprotein (pyridoxamine 5'-phosphate oxidase superfamily)